MSVIRYLLSFIIKFVDMVFGPGQKKLPAEKQRAYDIGTEGMSLYQFEACPFCVKTRWAIRRLGLNIELKDAKNDSQHRADLLAGGGKIQVPCLRIVENGVSQWMYESTAINEYLAKRFP